MSAIEIRISRVLRAGVAISLALIVAGTVVSFLRHPDYVDSTRALERLTEPGTAPSTIGAVVEGLRGGRGQAVVMVGLFVLILTPIARVTMSLALFLRERDRAFSVLTAAVLGLILLSILLGRVSG